MNPTALPLPADGADRSAGRSPNPATDTCDEFELRRAERLERLRRLGDLMAHVAERIETPDPSTLAASEPALRSEDELLERLQQLEVTVRNLLICVRGGGLERRPLPFAVLIGRCAEALAPQLAMSGASLELVCTLPATAEARVHPDAFAAMLQALAEPWLARGVRLRLTLAQTIDGRLELDCRRCGPLAGAVASAPLAAQVARIVAQAHEAELGGDPAGGRLTLRLPALAAEPAAAGRHVA